MATLSKEDRELMEFIINDEQSTEAEKKSAQEVLDSFSESKKTTTTKKTTSKKAPVKKTATKKTTSKMSDLEKKKAEIKKRTGKTLEECEKIIEQYKALKSSDATQKKKATTQKKQAKKRTSKLKKEGKVIQGTTEKNVEATLDTVTEKVVKKIDKEVDKIEKTSKTEKQVEKKISSLVTKAVRSNKKLFTDTAKELAKVDKNNAKAYLMSLKKEIDTLLKKYEYGGTVPSVFGQAGLVGETGTMNEVDLFAMGGTLPQGVHQYYAQTYNPAYPTPHGYAKGGYVYALVDGFDEPTQNYDQVYYKTDDYNELVYYVADLKNEREYSDDMAIVEVMPSGKMRKFDASMFAKGGYVYRESDDEDATQYLNKEEVMELIEEHNEFFDTDYKTIEDFNRGEEKANGIRSIEKMAKGGMITSAPEYQAVRNAEYDRRVKSGKIKDTDDNFERFDEMYFDELVEKGRIDPNNYFAKGGMTKKKNSDIIAEIEEIKSEITERPPYVYEREGQIKLSSEEGDEFSDYYGEFYEPLYVDARLEAIADKYNSYWEWENAGTLVLVQEYAKGGSIPQSAKDEFYQLRADDMDFADQYGEDDLQEWYEEQGRFAKGGKIGFDGLAKKVAKRYEGKSVPKKFQKEYGKTYDREEAMEVGKKVAGKVYREQQKMAKGGMIPFSTSNLYLNGFGKDSNGNSVVKVSFPNSRAFSIQTNGNLPKTHSLKQQNLKIENLSKKDLKIVEKEVNDYVKEFGSDSQIKKLNTYAKGGKTQGYNDKLDESLGNTKGKRSKKQQNYKDRRDESEAMEKKKGRRKYSRVKTMDKGNRKKRKTPMTLAKAIRKDGEKWQDAVKRATIMMKKSK